MIDEVVMQEVMAGKFSPPESDIQVGDMIFHNKRQSSYTVEAEVEGATDHDLKDGDVIELLTTTSQDFLNVMVQISTEIHSANWYVYRNLHDKFFLRPCSEFDTRRFTLA